MGGYRTEVCLGERDCFYLLEGFALAALSSAPCYIKASPLPSGPSSPNRRWAIRILLVLGYGFWVPFVICFVISEFLEFRMNVRFRGRWQVLVVAAISMALLYGIWQLSNCVSRP
jgi:hypothetical protein